MGEWLGFKSKRLGRGNKKRRLWLLCWVLAFMLMAFGWGSRVKTYCKHLERINNFGTFLPLLSLSSCSIHVSFRFVLCWICCCLDYLVWLSLFCLSHTCIVLVCLIDLTTPQDNHIFYMRHLIWDGEGYFWNKII